MKYTTLVALLALAACGKPAATSSSNRIKTISTGERFAASDYSAPGRVVLLDFGADW